MSARAETPSSVVPTDAAVAPRWLRNAAAALVALIVALGLWARFAGLGGRPLAIDEYYFMVSIRSILTDGLPTMPGGGYYARGLFIQYLTAAAIGVTGDTMLGLRIVPTLFGLGSVALAYVYGTRIANRRVGVALALLLLASSWEVEFSRFGRMYAPLQFCTLLFATGLTWTVEGRGGVRRYTAPLALLLGMLTHQMAVLLAPVLFAPMLLPNRLERFGGRKGLLVYGVTSAVTAAVSLALFQLVSAVRMYGVQAAMPLDYQAGAAAPDVSGLLVVPGFPFWRVAEAPLANLAFVVGAIALTGALLTAWTRLRPSVGATHVLAGMALVAALLHQLAVAGLLVLFVLAHDRSRLFEARNRGSLLALAAATSFAIAWLGVAGFLTFGLGSRAWIERAGESVFRWAVHGTFFGWPDLYTPTLGPWLEAAPLVTGLLLVAFLASAWWRADRPIEELARGPGLLLLSMAVVIGALSQLYYSTRYWYFLYPQMLALLLIAGWEAAGRIPAARRWAGRLGVHAGTVGLGAAMVLFSLTDDFNPAHLANVASTEVGLRTNGFQRYETFWYRRDDVRAPAEFVNEHVDPGNGVGIIVEDLPQVSYYLEASHAVFYERGSDRFRNVSRREGTIDLWSGERLLSTEAEVREYTRDLEEVWILRHANPAVPVLDVENVWSDRIEEVEERYIGPDGFAMVLRVALRESRGRP